MIVGPTVATVPVHIDSARVEPSSILVTDTNQYGITVVEQPVMELASPGSSQGHVTLAVQPGVTCVLAPGQHPWSVSQPDEKASEMLQVSA